MGWMGRTPQPRGPLSRGVFGDVCRRTKQYASANWRNAVTVLLTVVLCSQALFGSGVSIAFAETLREAGLTSSDALQGEHIVPGGGRLRK